MGDEGTPIVTVRRQQENRWYARKKADAVVRLLRGELMMENEVLRAVA